MLGNVEHQQNWIVNPGMSLRDHFAGLAMEGMLSESEWWFGHDGSISPDIARKAYLIANTMIAHKRVTESPAPHLDPEIKTRLRSLIVSSKANFTIHGSMQAFAGLLEELEKLCK